MQRLVVSVDGAERAAVLYTRYAAPAAIGDRVVLNTTADGLGLGSGGQDFVVWNLASESYDALSGGHIMKLRYTPAQSDVLTTDAGDSLDGMPVIAISVHSQLLPVVAALGETRVAYVMTDGGALEASFSDTVAALPLAGVVTAGHAIGGDLEAVNVYTGLLAARHALAADVIVCGMGPGVVGTGTSFGTTALELGTTVNATAALGGRPVACVRMSSADSRDRHAGVSHHTIVSLSRVALAGADVPVPVGTHLELPDRHRVVEVDASGIFGALERTGLSGSHMGRGPDADPLFFLAAAAAGYHAATIL